MTGRGFMLCALAASLGLAGPAASQSAPDLRLATDTADTADATATAPPVQMLPQPEEVPPRRRTADPDPYEPLGLRAGGLILHASLGIGGEVDSNVTHAHRGGTSGVGGVLRPGFSFASDWVRHSWTGAASATLKRYLDHPEMATGNVSAATDFRLDIRRTTTAELSASYTLDRSARVDSGIPGSEVGDAAEHTVTTAAALNHDLGVVQLRGSAGLTRKVFGDVALSGGGVQDNSDRDYWEPQLALRASYAASPVIRPFVEASYAPRLHDRRRDRNGIARNSQGLGFRAGVAYDDGPIWSGEVSLDYLRRSYADATLAANGAWGVTGTVNWSPTELTRLSLTLGTSLTESTVAGVAGGVQRTLHLDASQSLRDNLDLTAGAGLTYETTASGADYTYDGSLGLLWKLNRNMGVTAGYGFTLLDASEPARSYVNHTLSLGVLLQH